jgi:rhodanese-related sulfurtransferase
MHLSKKNFLEIFVILLASVIFGLGRNYFSETPLLLFSVHEKTVKPEKQIHFSEADADFVRQVSIDPGTVLIDARLPELFERGHIPGAISLPLSRFDDFIAERMERLRAAHLLVVYCSGWSCNDSYDLARRLQDKGFKDLLLYRGGVEDWQEKGNAVAR